MPTTEIAVRCISCRLVVLSISYLLVGAVAAVAVALVAVVMVAEKGGPLPRPRRRRHRSGHEAAFAASVARGDWKRAERDLRRAFVCGRREPRTSVTELRTMVAGSASDIAASLRQRDNVGRWFPHTGALDQTHRTVALGRRIELNDICTRWTSSTSISFHAVSEGCDIDGVLTLRPVVGYDLYSGMPTDSVAIHVRVSAAGPHQRYRVLRAVYSTILDGLTNLEDDYQRVLE